MIMFTVKVTIVPLQNEGIQGGGHTSTFNFILVFRNSLRFVNSLKSLPFDRISHSDLRTENKGRPVRECRNGRRVVGWAVRP